MALNPRSGRALGPREEDAADRDLRSNSSLGLHPIETSTGSRDTFQPKAEREADQDCNDVRDAEFSHGREPIKISHWKKSSLSLVCFYICVGPLQQIEYHRFEENKLTALPKLVNVSAKRLT